MPCARRSRSIVECDSPSEHQNDPRPSHVLSPNLEASHAAFQLGSFIGRQRQRHMALLKQGTCFSQYKPLANRARGSSSLFEAVPMASSDIHVCISAYACDPTRGSEPGIGWNIVQEVARRHRVWAITRRKNEPAIAAELSRAPLPNLQMVYYDLPTARAWKHGQIGIEVYYRLWQRLTRLLVRRLHRDVGLDITQHATFGRYWGPVSVAYASPPFIWGPVGGGETAPAAFRADFSRWGRTYEYLRDRARGCSEWDPAVRRAAQRAAVALAVTPETGARLEALGTKRVELFSAMGFSRAQYEELNNVPAAKGTTMRFLSMGRLLQWKGFHLGLKAFAAAALPAAEYGSWETVRSAPASASSHGA